MAVFPHLNRRRFAALLLAPGCAVLLPAAARAADYPERQVKVVVPFGAGGNADAVGRLVAEALTGSLKQTFVVENRPGGGGSLGAGVVAQSAPDGYTLLIGSNGPLTVNPFVQAKLAYRPLDDFAPIALAASVPHVLVAKAGLPAKTLQELVALSKNEYLVCGTSGVGSATHLTLARFTAATGARIEHVPYKGGNTPVQDLLGGGLSLAAMELSTALPLHKAGKVRMLAMASAQRSPLAPDVPTFAEGGVPNFVAASYVGLLAPAATPPAVRRALEAAAQSSLGTPQVAERLQAMGAQLPAASERTGSGFAAFLKAEYERSREAARLAAVVPE